MNTGHSVPKNESGSTVASCANRCQSCRYWSEMIAEFSGGELRAYCLAQNGPNYHEFTSETSSCAQHEPGLAVDDPSRQVT